MSRRPASRAGGLIAAVVVAVALWFGAATPGLAVANESPSPPALATLIGCTGSHHLASTTIDGCSPIAHGSSSAVHSPTTRRFPLGLTGPAGVFAVIVVAGIVIVLVAQQIRRADGGLVGARAPPVSAS